MLQQQGKATTFATRDGIVAQLKLADEVASLNEQKRLRGNADNRLRRNLLGFKSARS